MLRARQELGLDVMVLELFDQQVVSIWWRMVVWSTPQLHLNVC
jgi:hypothetical protein